MIILFQVSVMKGFRKKFFNEKYYLLQNIIFEQFNVKQQHNELRNQSTSTLSEPDKNIVHLNEINDNNVKPMTKDEFFEQIASFENKSYYLYYFPFFPPIKTSENEHFDLYVFKLKLPIFK